LVDPGINPFGFQGMMNGRNKKTTCWWFFRAKNTIVLQDLQAVD
jgi:hypothetical protein